jgi:hypothetical protein
MNTETDNAAEVNEGVEEYSPEILALAKFLQEDPADISEESDNVYSLGRQEYIVADDATADTLCADAVKESLWAFNPSFLSGETGLDEGIFEALSDKCEGAQDAYLSMIKATCGLDTFIEAAVSAGRGHFLAQYDEEEGEVTQGGTMYFIYRTN